MINHQSNDVDTTTNLSRVNETRTCDTGVNRMLDKFVPIVETAYVEKPYGMARPDEFHMRQMWREDVPRIFARAAELGLR